MKKFRKLFYEELKKEHLSVLREIGRQIGVKMPAGKKKDKLISDILAIQAGTLEPVPPSKIGAPPKIRIDVSKYYDSSESEENVQYEYKSNDYLLKDSGASDEFEIEGVLELTSSTYGFLRVNNYENSKEDAFVSLQNIKKYNLRRGDKVKAKVRLEQNEKSAALQSVIAINDLQPELFLKRAKFDDLIPYYPTKRIKLETKESSQDLAIRCMDLFSPLGMGQRGLIVAPPKTGKTTLLKKIANSIEQNHKDVKLIILLIDERPEEVTDFKRSVKGEVVFSTFDENPLHHIRAAELVVNRAKRLVEVGQDVVILMDSITKLTRAYNNTVESSGKTLSGGIDPVALQGPKRFFGAARNIENGGSLTILSTALVETGNRMDDVIYEEFKGTGNMEIHLSRELSEKRVFPAIDLFKSGTRNDELLLSEKEASAVYKLRKILSERHDATDSLLEMLKKTKDNQDLISKVDAWVKLYSK
ncbi:MAG: transcription termination factor Rho [Clostridia bacterium]|nr:transcription termination factor Rho [Clostridia bacterium]